MSEYYPLRTNEDLLKLWEVCNNFETPARIVTMNQAPDISQTGFPDLILYLSGNDIPMVKILLHRVFCWKFDNAPVVALELGRNNEFRVLRLWHGHSSEEEKAATTSWIMADSIEWKRVDDQFE